MGFPHFNNNFCEGGDLNGYHPFRFWCYNILPLIFDDSLSQYEIICKLYDQMNKVVQDTVTLTNLMDCFTDFIRDMQTHLNNLIDDVNSNISQMQQDIEDKLFRTGDTMSGTLNMDGNKIINIPDPIDDGDAVNKSYVDINDNKKVNKSGDTMTGSLNMGNNSITNVANPVNNGDAVNKLYVNTEDAKKVNKSGDTMTGTLNMGGNKISNVSDPSNNGDATNKNYVDTKIASLGTILEYKGSKPTVSDLPPTGNKIGDVWYVESEKSAYAWVVDVANPSGHWEEFGPPINFEPYLKHNGSVAMTGDLNMGNHKIVNITAPTNDNDATNKKYVDDSVSGIDLSPYLKHDGTVPMTGNLNLNDNRIMLEGDNNIYNTLYHNMINVEAPDGDTQMHNVKLSAGKAEYTSELSLMESELWLRTLKPVPEGGNHQMIYKDGTLRFHPQGDIDLTGGTVSNLNTPVNNTDAANKKYVDDKIADIPQPDMSDYLKRDGSLPMTGTLNFEDRKTNENKPYIQFGDWNQCIYTINTPETMSYTLRLQSGRDNEQLSKLDISNDGITFKPNPGNAIWANTQIKNVNTPTDENDAANKKYVDEHPGGVQPITVTRDEAYISTPDNNFTTKTVADPTAPPERPIQKDQIAVYSETNQTYEEDDVQATLLVADPHSAMEAVNKRTLDGYLSKANIDDTFKRVTAVTGTNPGTEDFIITENNIDSTNPLRYADRIITTNNDGLLQIGNLKLLQINGNKGYLGEIYIDKIKFPISSEFGRSCDFSVFSIFTGSTAEPANITLKPTSRPEQPELNNKIAINIQKPEATIKIYRQDTTSTAETIIIDATEITFKVKEPVNNKDAVSKNYADTNFIKVEGTPQEGSTIAYRNGKWTVVDHTTWNPLA